MNESRIRPDRADQIGQLFARLLRVRASVNHRLRRVEDNFSDLMSLILELKAEVTELREAVRGQAELSERFSECMRQASATQEKLAESFHERMFVQPVAQQVFQLIDFNNRLSDACSCGNGTTVTAGNLNQLKDLLYRLAITPIEVKAGESFDPGVMRPIKVVNCDDPLCDKTVSEVHTVGFRLHDQILRYASVSVYKYKGNQEKERALCT